MPKRRGNVLPQREGSDTKHRDAARPPDVTDARVTKLLPKCGDNTDAKGVNENCNSEETMAGLPAVARLLFIVRDVNFRSIY